jgi:hypothetical protein
MSERPNIFSRAASSVADFFVSWWRAAAGPIRWHNFPSPFRAILHRMMLWIPVAVLVTALVGAAGVYGLTGWRARDLADRAMESARSGNLAMARLQVASATNLRSRDAAVQRAKIFVQSRLNDPGALASWQKLAGESALTAEELEERARLAMVAGTEEQFAASTEALAKEGLAARAAALRSSRQLRRGNLAGSIAEARDAAAQSDDAAKKLELLRLLLTRHGPMLNVAGAVNPEDRAGREEIIALVDELQATPQGNEAIALTLGAFPLPAEKTGAWAEAAWQDRSPTNPALLPAARFKVALGTASADDVAGQLAPLFAGVEVAQQAAFAGWLNAQGKWADAAMLITPARAAQNAVAFEMRAQALASLERWQDLLAMSEAASNAPESLRLVYRGMAAQKLGRVGIAPKSLADAVRAAVREGTLAPTLQAVDALGEGKLADPIIVEMCGSPGMTDRMFRVARDRFGRRGQFATMAKAWEAAVQAAPDAPAVQDYRRRMDLLEGRAVASTETAAAVAAAPADPAVRFTHALALLREGRPGDALGAFHDLDVFVDRLAPGDQAIVVAIYEANGMGSHAAALRRSLDARLLEQGEYALILR